MGFLRTIQEHSIQPFWKRYENFIFGMFCTRWISNFFFYQCFLWGFCECYRNIPSYHFENIMKLWRNVCTRSNGIFFKWNEKKNYAMQFNMAQGCARIQIPYSERKSTEPQFYYVTNDARYKCQLVSDAHFFNWCIANFYANTPVQIWEVYHP